MMVFLRSLKPRDVRWCQSRLVPGCHHTLRRSASRLSSVFRVSEEVQQALSERRPVVALETAVYTHGFPYPDNIALASLLESIVRTTGAVPATIGVLDGIARIGLDAEELIRLAGSAGLENTIKVSRRDLAFACGRGSPGRRLNGGTTVAGTMILAHMAGIKVFATGGLGGVHRGAESSMDISADLTELGRTPVAVISSGCKSFLDIPRTLEYLETEGVPVSTFADGRSGKVDFPGFWTRDSGSRSPVTIQTEREAAQVIDAQHRLGLQTGIFFGNPIPQELSISKADMDHTIESAITEAAAAGATGNANTPYILNKIKELTGSKSVESNRGLLAANAKRGALVAIELAKLQADANEESASDKPSGKIIGPGAINYSNDGVSKGVSSPKIEVAVTQPEADSQRSTARQGPAEVFVAGSLAIDLGCDLLAGSISGADPDLHTSNPAMIQQTIGGVGHNVARAVHFLGVPVKLCSMVGDDLAGSTATSALLDVDMDTTGLQRVSSSRTSQYVAVNGAEKDLFVAMADMAIMEKKNEALDRAWVDLLKQDKPKALVVDGNWDPQMCTQWLSEGRAIGASIFFEPVSTAKASRIFKLQPRQSLRAWPTHTIDVMTPNQYELQAMHTAAKTSGLFEQDDWWQVIDALGIPSSGARTQLSMATSPTLVDKGIPQQSIQLLPFIPSILTKLGRDGVLLTQLIPAGDSRLHSGEYAPYIISRCANDTEQSMKVGGLYMRLFPAADQVTQDDIVSVNGVGDTFLGALVAGFVRGQSKHIEGVVPFAQRAAVMTLKSRESVAPELKVMD